MPNNVTLERCTNDHRLMTFHHGELYAFGSGSVTTKGDGTAYAIGPNARAGLVSVGDVEGKIVTLLGAYSIEIRANL